MDNKTLVVSLVVLIIAGVVFFNFEKFTGEAVKKTDMTKLYVATAPEVIDQVNPVIGKGKYVYFTEMPGNKGGSGTLYIRSMSKDRKWGPIVRTQVFKNCNSNKCNPSQVGTLNFKTYFDWAGEYCGEVTDFATWKTVKACFTVK